MGWCHWGNLGDGPAHTASHYYSSPTLVTTLAASNVVSAFTGYQHSGVVAGDEVEFGSSLNYSQQLAHQTA